MIRIMFICLGNICRSPMAEFVMKELVRRAGEEKEFEIASSATSREEIGNDIHYGTRRMLEEMNIPFTRRAAVQLTRADYDKYDLLLAMDTSNLRNIERITGGDPEGKVHLLLEYAGENRSIADPWYTGDFEETWRDVLRGCEALYKSLKKQK
ncbi:MAG: low molecular weight phosphotyrosine protein phosphatase [Clostridia bacterium]|nr:low molecular weight phosphotyrosine protein phosphatase [Clostridia bacterium]